MRMHPSESGRPIRCARFAGSVECISRRTCIVAPGVRQSSVVCQPKSHTRIPLRPMPRMWFSLNVPSARYPRMEPSLMKVPTGVLKCSLRPGLPVETSVPPMTAHGRLGVAISTQRVCLVGDRSTASTACGPSDGSAGLAAANLSATGRPVTHRKRSGTSRSKALRSTCAAPATSTGASSCSGKLRGCEKAGTHGTAAVEAVGTARSAGWPQALKPDAMQKTAATAARLIDPRGPHRRIRHCKGIRLACPA